MQFWQIDLPIPKMHLTRPIALLPVAHLLVTDCTDGARVPNPQLMRHWEEKDERGTALSTSRKPIQMAEDEAYHSSGPSLEVDVSVQTLEAIGPPLFATSC